MCNGNILKHSNISITQTHVQLKYVMFYKTHEGTKPESQGSNSCWLFTE